MKTKVVMLLALFVLIQYRMDLLAFVMPGGPTYDPEVHGEVVLLSTASCRYCTSEKRYLTEHGVPFVEYDVANDARGAELLRFTGRYGVPVLLVGDEVVQGFDPLAIRGAFARVAQAAAPAAQIP
ncbi:MAG: glutaredoxin domain-containing protein [Pseudomonadota bacterium]